MSFHTDIVNSDIVSMFQSGIEAGKYCVCARDGCIWNKQELQGLDLAGIDFPWIFVNNPPDYFCQWQHDIANLFGFIPTHCLNCWKVVVRPQNLQQLFQLLKLMEEMVAEDPTCMCKCGTEPRPTVNGNYGGYFYNRSKEQMQEKYKRVKKLVHRRIHPSIDVIPKRYCSEFEAKFGPSDKYEQAIHAQLWEPQIEEYCKMQKFPYQQPEIIKRKVIREWIKRAWDIGDPTVYEYTDGRPLTRPVVRYEPEEESRGESQE